MPPHGMRQSARDYTEANEVGVTLDCYEPNGADPKDDPRNTTRVLERSLTDNEGRYWRTDGAEKVLVLRPFA